MRRMTQRMLHAAHNRTLPSEQLRAIVALRVELGRLEHQAVRDLRQSGVSWDDIAGMLGVSRQAVQKRFSR